MTNANDYSVEEIEHICVNFTPEKIVEKMASRDVFAGLIDGWLVGTVSLEGDKLHSLFVDAPQQRRGLGATLVSHVEALARSRGVKKLRASSSITAKAFYASRGYAVIQLEERPFGSTWLMEKAL